MGHDRSIMGREELTVEAMVPLTGLSVWALLNAPPEWLADADVGKRMATPLHRLAKHDFRSLSPSGLGWCPGRRQRPESPGVRTAPRRERPRPG